MYMTNFISFDIESLEQAIHSFMLEHDHDPAFLIMSTKSVYFFKATAYEKCGYTQLENISCSYEAFQGIPIATCDALPFGEVRVV